jgi:hypothetical protein
LFSGGGASGATTGYLLAAFRAALNRETVPDLISKSKLAE